MQRGSSLLTILGIWINNCEKKNQLSVGFNKFNELNLIIFFNKVNFATKRWGYKRSYGAFCRQEEY